MSMGIGARANIIFENGDTVVYEYGGYDLNEPKYRNKDHIDGKITISKNCFVEPNIHERIRKMPGKRGKHVIKRIPVPVDYEKMLKTGLIQVENCSNCWKRSEDLCIDVMVYKILFRIFNQYQEDGEIPEHIYYYV